LTKIRLDNSDDPIDICYDNVFKAVFTKPSPESQGALSSLVSALIGQEVTVDTITANEPAIDNLHDRRMRFDIACRTTKEEPINVEMSLNPTPFELVRLEFHIGKLFTGQDIQGDKDYSYLKPAYQIAVLAKKRFFEDEEFLHTFEYYDPEHGVSLNGRSRIITLELSKVDQVVDKPIQEMTASELWAVFFRYLTDKSKREKINEILEVEEGIAMASEVLMTISRDEAERARLVSEFKYQVDMRSHINHAKQEGRAERDQEIARNLKADGDSVEKIARITGLSLEEIAKL
jgi:predicted transposase/invertase (TIGR01784 family)